MRRLAQVSFSLNAAQSLTLTLTLTLSRYWVVLGVFSLVELLLDLAINPLAYSFPAYLILKCAFLAWCMAPVEWNGSDVIFNNVSDSYPSDFDVSNCPMIAF